MTNYRKQTYEIKTTEQITRGKWSWIGQSSKGKCNCKGGYEWNPQGQRQRDGREQYERKLWLLGRRGEKSNNSARTM
jgi:hypothetical protein